MGTSRQDGYASGRLRRQQILEAATALFARAGFEGTTILEIADTVGLSRAGVLHHFPTKEALLLAVLEQRDRDDLDRFRRNGSGNAGGLGILRGTVELARHNARYPHLIGLYAVLSAEAYHPAHPAHQYFLDRYERIRAGTRRALELAGAAGFLAPDVDVDRESITLVALMDGLQIQWLLAPKKVDMAAELSAAIQRLLCVPLDSGTPLQASPESAQLTAVSA